MTCISNKKIEIRREKSERRLKFASKIKLISDILRSRINVSLNE